MTPHWPAFFTWWMIGGAVLYSLIWWRVLTRGANAWFSSMAAIPLTLYWVAPPICYFALFFGHFQSAPLMAVIPLALVAAALGIAPIWVYWRAQGREREAAEQARVADAEQIIRRFGA